MPPRCPGDGRTPRRWLGLAPALVGLHWGAHALHQPERIAETLAALLALYREGKVEPVVYRTYPLEELPAALEALGSRQSYGKVVVAP